MKPEVLEEVKSIIRTFKLSCTPENFKTDDSIRWSIISFHQNLSEDFIREFKDNVAWGYISKFQRLSEDFIREFQNRVKWDPISVGQTLSENFIREFQNKVVWICISQFQKLSENFIREFQDKVYWPNISEYQKLSEDFIWEFQDKVDWKEISKAQKLSENFIREFKDKVNWSWISCCQVLSEDFIREFKDRVDWDYISISQKLSADFKKEFKVKTGKNNWLYKDTEFKKESVLKTKLYECHDDYFIAYKGIRSNRYSRFNFQYQYLPGNTYESTADFTDKDNSFGLSAWTEADARKYCPELIIKVKIRYEDVARIVHNDGKIRCTKFEVLD